MRRRASFADGSWYSAGPENIPITRKINGSRVPGSLMVVQERVPGLRILLNVVVHTERLQDSVEFPGGPRLARSFAP